MYIFWDKICGNPNNKYFQIILVRIIHPSLQVTEKYKFASLWNFIRNMNQSSIGIDWTDWTDWIHDLDSTAQTPQLRIVATLA